MTRAGRFTKSSSTLQAQNSLEAVHDQVGVREQHAPKPIRRKAGIARIYNFFVHEAERCASTTYPRADLPHPHPHQHNHHRAHGHAPLIRGAPTRPLLSVSLRFVQQRCRRCASAQCGPGIQVSTALRPAGMPPRPVPRLLPCPVSPASCGDASVLLVVKGELENYLKFYITRWARGAAATLMSVCGPF